MIKTRITVINKKEEMREIISHCRKNNNLIGFVPTMGSLHQGHLSLVEKAREMSDIVIISIYVNPSQFSQNEDFSKYPRDLSSDLALLEKYKPDFVFYPQEDQMYQKDHHTWVNVTGLEDKLCGKSRQEHFKGVATIVLKLLNIVTPDLMFMGEKDYQQLVIMGKVLSDLDLPVKIVPCPTVREKDGLAMSSRNNYLTPEGRKKATLLFQALSEAKELFQNGLTDPGTVVSEMRKLIEQKGGKIDYIEAFEKQSLESVDVLKIGTRIALAVFIEGTRLIDNIEL